MLEVDSSLVIVGQIQPNLGSVADEMKTIVESFFHIQFFLPRVLEQQAFLIDALVDQVLLGHEFVIRVLAVSMEVENGLAFVLEFLDILANASVDLIKFLVAFLPRIENDGLEQLFILRVRLDGFQELNKLMLKTILWHGLGVRTLRTAVMVVRIAFALVTPRVASG